MAKRNRDSVFDEPHMQGRGFRPDPSEARVDRTIRAAPGSADSDALKAERSVWDEPAIASDLSGGAPDGALTYARWLQREWDRVTPERSWLATVGIALAAGPWALLGAFVTSAHVGSAFGFLAVVVFAPVIEEMMKVGAALWVAEKRPFLFDSPHQIIVCGLAAGLVFGVVENVLYLGVYFPNAGAMLIAWRWTACTSLHVVCSLIASFGVVRMWRDARDKRERPRVSVAFRWLAAAMVVHGTYNGLAIVGSALGLLP